MGPTVPAVAGTAAPLASPGPVTAAPPQAAPVGPPCIQTGAYGLGERFDARGPVERLVGYRAAADGPGQAPVVLLREPSTPPTGNGTLPPWPGLAWEEELRTRCPVLGLPRVLDRFEAGGHRYLVLEAGDGPSFWDVWDDPAYGAFEQFAWLIQLAELLSDLHQLGVILESLRPDQVRIDPFGRVRMDATVVLLPVPLPAEAPVRPTLSTAPELYAGGVADARSDLYCFGALLYALHCGHDLTDLDLRPDGTPVPFAERFPDAHPVLVRLIGKTFCPARAGRFPSGPGDDLSGFEELTDALRQAQRALGQVRLEVAGWSTAGMVRAGNEDALAFVHTVEAREHIVEDYAVVIAADGIGGNAAGEVAALHAVRSLRRSLMSAPPFAALADDPGATSTNPAGSPADARRRVSDALAEANRCVFQAAREAAARHGMGCTAEVVYLGGRQVVVGHVGDSRTYHFHGGQLEQVTQDHTLVSRLVRLGELAPREAETHPRRGELERALGGRADVEPEVYSATLTPGDWVVVCTDGLTRKVPAPQIQDVLERSASAEQAARRLANRANQAGADDNVTVVVVRAC
jgi:protein phosphatase